LNKRLFQKSRFFYITAFLIFSQGVYAESNIKTEECLSTREYITTLKFLNKKVELGLNEKDKLALADFVSNGCTGAAERFIKTLNLLIEAEVPSNNALPVAKEISQGSDKGAENYQAIFKKVYVETFFDLPAKVSLEFANELTGPMEKESSKMIEDFNILSDFCLNRTGLDLGLAKCSDLIKNVLGKTKNLNITIAKDYINLFDFLNSNEKGPKLSSSEAVSTAEKIIIYGPVGASNFIEGYQFSLSENGLKSKIPAAISFGQKMAAKTFKK
jgi:hypothetical protein